MNFKKQVLRYRLKADQKIGRANKTEVLTDELLQIERRLDHTRSACMSVYKKILQCQQSVGADLEKRMKKLPETAVANAMLEASNQLAVDTESALQKSLKVCADAQTGVAKERAIYEMFVEGHVITPLQTLVETDIPNIQKLRDRLKRLVLDRDNAHSAWQKAHKAQYNPGVNIQQMSVKADSMKDELDAAISRMDLCKDQLITELYDFIAKEGTYAQHMTDFVEKELDYHKRCVAHLEKLKPELESAKENASAHSSYGTSLAEHLRLTEREIAIPIESCISCLLDIGIYEEGIFRIAGGAAKMKKFRALVGAGVMDLHSYDAQDDIHAVAGTLKQYLRELPDPLLTQELHSEWVASSSITDNQDKLREIWSLVDRLPKENKANLGYLIRFCSALASKQEYNKMSAANISLVLAPNLLWAPNDDITATMMVSNSVAGIIESMITYVDYFFPEVPDFKVQPPPPTPDKVPGHGRTPSGGSMGETSGGILTTAHTNPSVPTPNSPSHSRNSSAETAAHNHNQGENTLKKKKKAPPAPTGQSRTNQSLPTADATAGNKPPAATKRTHSKRPSMPPPARPNSSSHSVSVEANPKSSSSSDAPSKPATAPKPTPHPKPRIPLRRPQPLSDGQPSPRRPPLSNIDFENPPPPPDDFPAIPESVETSLPPNSIQNQTGNSEAGMSDFPPPPDLNQLDEACGPDLSAELASAPVVKSKMHDEVKDDDDDGECEMTQL